MTPDPTETKETAMQTIDKTTLTAIADAMPDMLDKVVGHQTNRRTGKREPITVRDCVDGVDDCEVDWLAVFTEHFDPR